MRMKKLFAALLLLMAFMAGCTPPKEKEYTGFYLDTLVSLSCYEKDADALFAACRERLAKIHQTFDAYGDDSELFKLNASNGEWFSLSEEAFFLVSLAVDCALETGGAFDPTVYPAVLAWDSMSGKTIPGAAELKALLPLIDYRGIELDKEGKRVRLKDGQMLDLGGIAKGYAADELKKIYDEFGASGIINLGGNVYAVGEKPNRQPFVVAIRDPKDAASLKKLLELRGQCAVTSGDYQRFFERDGVLYHHILDPDTLMPTRTGISSATLIMQDCARADAYATALVVMGREKAEEFCRERGLFAVLITDQGEVISIEP